MIELYWLTRLDTVNTILILLLVLGCVVAIISTFVLFDIRGGYKYEEDKDYILTKKVLKISSIATSIICLLFILVPTQKQALIIWGVGGTIDYVKSNDTAKQLPDKCIKALDKWVDEYMLDENKNKEK